MNNRPMEGRKIKNLTFALLCLLPALTCQARTIIIDANGSGHYPTIQEAINDSNDGDIIILTPGTYTGPGNRDIDFLGKAVTVRSTDPNDPNIVAATIINCQGNKTDYHRGFHFHNNENADSILSGFTITNGYAGSGGGIACLPGSPQITNCKIIANWAKVFGGGVYCRNSSPKIFNCIVGENSAGWVYPGGAGGGAGGIFCFDGNPMIANCIVKDNIAGSTGGIHCVYGNTKIENCVVENNTSKWNYAGIYCYSSNSVAIKNCIVTGNKSINSLGGGISCGGTGNNTTIISNCLINNNEAKNGAGIHCFEDSVPIIMNCTITSNSAAGIYCCEKSDPIIRNSILWKNKGDQIHNLSSGTIVSYSCIQGSWHSEGNIDADPCFVNAANGDYHLFPTSPCINAGDHNYVAEHNETDLDGLPRVIGARIDMGAYEFNHQPIAVAGPNQVAYAWIDGFADVNLDGSGSYDDDNDVLDYYWFWTIDGNDYEANGVSPTIQLPIGEHIIELIVNDGIDDSEPNWVNITVIEPMESHLWVFPRLINRHSRMKRIMAVIRLPKGIKKGDIKDEPLILYPDGDANSIEAMHQYIIQPRRRRFPRTIIFAFFDKAELMEIVPNGRVQLYVVGMFDAGQYFYGSDTIWIKGRRGRPWR